MPRLLSAVVAVALSSLLLAGCAAPAPEPTVAATPNAELVPVDRPGTKCAAYVGWDENDQHRWRSANGVDPAKVTSVQLLDACGAQSSERITDVFSGLMKLWRDGVQEEPANSAFFAGTTDVTSTDGYTFSVKYDVTLGAPFTKNITKEKPGYSSIMGKPTAKIALTNTTPGRDLTFNVIGFGTSPGGHFAGMFQVAGIFPAGSPVCDLVAGGYGPPPPTVSARLWKPAEGCAYVYMNAPVGADGTDTVTLSPNSVRQLSAFGSVGGLETYSSEYASNVRSSSGPMIVAHVSDAAYPAVFAALSAPPKVVLAISGGSLVKPSLSCQVIATSDKSPGC